MLNQFYFLNSYFLKNQDWIYGIIDNLFFKKINY